MLYDMLSVFSFSGRPFLCFLVIIPYYNQRRNKSDGEGQKRVHRRPSCDKMSLLRYSMCLYFHPLSRLPTIYYDVLSDILSWFDRSVHVVVKLLFIRRHSQYAREQSNGHLVRATKGNNMKTFQSDKKYPAHPGSF